MEEKSGGNSKILALGSRGSVVSVVTGFADTRNPTKAAAESQPTHPGSERLQNLAAWDLGNWGSRAWDDSHLRPTLLGHCSS